MNKLIKFQFFTRNHGISKGIYKSLNCGFNSKDKEINIKKNIEIAVKKITRKKKLLILPKQFHSNKAMIVKKSEYLYKCDGIVTNDSDFILGITTADCLPIIFKDPKKKIVGICHAGWRGLVSGIIENTVKKMLVLKSNNIDIHAYIGPCIRKMSYEVSEKFVDNLKPKYQNFAQVKGNKIYYDLPKLAKHILGRLQINKIHDYKKSTFSDDNYFSYREAKKKGSSDYGRNISLITLN